MRKWDFNKVGKQLYGNHTSAWVFSCKFAAYFLNIFLQEHLRGTASGSCFYFLKTKAFEKCSQRFSVCLKTSGLLKIVENPP